MLFIVRRSYFDLLFIVYHLYNIHHTKHTFIHEHENFLYKSAFFYVFYVHTYIHTYVHIYTHTHKLLKQRTSRKRRKITSNERSASIILALCRKYWIAKKKVLFQTLLYVFRVFTFILSAS